ncbi:MAG: FAD:protein FMN transferase [Ignavibacteria bacterium]|nr:FAD:protein FMN transferase [Ignavibacteria bacterium]
MKKYFLYILIFIGLISCTKDETIKRTSIVMGSTIEIQVRGVDDEIANSAITAAFKEAKRIDTLFSTYISGNPMWFLNNSTKEEIKVSDEMFSMLEKCAELWRITDGAFDPAIGSLIELIGFEKESPSLPTNEQIKNALNKTGWKKITLKKEDVVIKPLNIKISFNAVVPGYAADKIANVLKGFGIEDFLINVGGEIYAEGDTWRVGIQHPRKITKLLGSLKANKIGIATSGDYEQYFNKNGKRYSHLINPLTGLPANECEAVTIIAKDALTADALSTGVFILGPSKGIELINKLYEVEGIIVDTFGVIHKSSGFDKYFLVK